MAIDKYIPIPAADKGSRYPWRELLEVGDSFFVAEIYHRVASAALQQRNRTGREYRCRVEEKDGVKGVRVWRLS